MQINSVYTIAEASSLPNFFQSRIKDFYQGSIKNIMAAHLKEPSEVSVIFSFSNAVFPYSDSIEFHQHLISCSGPKYSQTKQSIEIVQFIRDCHPNKRLISRHDLTSFSSLFMLKKLGFRVVQRISTVPEVIILQLDPKTSLKKYNRKNKSILFDGVQLNTARHHLSEWLNIEYEELKNQSPDVLLRSGCLHWETSKLTLTCLWIKKEIREAFISIAAQSSSLFEQYRKILLDKSIDTIYSPNTDNQIRDFMFFCGYLKEGSVTYYNTSPLAIYRKFN